MTKILVDGGAAINIMPYAVYRKLGKGDQDLTKTDMMLKDFEGNVSPVKGAICVESTIDNKTLLSVFSPRGVTPTSKFVCVLPFPDGDARRHRDLSWFGQEKALHPAGGEKFVLSCT